VGKGITPLDPLKATLVEIVCGTLLLTASIAGVPVSLAEIITCSVIGFGAAHSGILLTTQNRHVRLMYSLWPVCPLITCALSYGMATLVALLAGR
jgi:sulfate permease